MVLLQCKLRVGRGWWFQCHIFTSKRSCIKVLLAMLWWHTLNSNWGLTKKLKPLPLLAYQDIFFWWESHEWCQQFLSVMYHFATELFCIFIGCICYDLQQLFQTIHVKFSFHFMANFIELLNDILDNYKPVLYSHHAFLKDKGLLFSKF